jgi:hypothetical protein
MSLEAGSKRFLVKQPPFLGFSVVFKHRFTYSMDLCYHSFVTEDRVSGIPPRIGAAHGYTLPKPKNTVEEYVFFRPGV